MKTMSTLIPFNFAGYPCHLISYQYSHGHVFAVQNFKTKHIISLGKGPSLICLYNIKLDDSNSTSHTIPLSINMFWIPWVKRSIVLLNEALSKLAWLENIVWWGMNVFGLLNFIACILIQVLALHKIYTMTFSKHAASHYFTIIEK